MKWSADILSSLTASSYVFLSKEVTGVLNSLIAQGIGFAH